MSGHASLKEAVSQIEAEAYRRGWEEAMAAVQRAAAKSQHDLFSNPINKNSERDQSTIQLVKQIIIKEPGLTGIQIVERSVEKDETAHERTVRTALRRLRIRGIIEIKNSRWYLCQPE